MIENMKYYELYVQKFLEIAFKYTLQAQSLSHKCFCICLVACRGVQRTGLECPLLDPYI